MTPQGPHRTWIPPRFAAYVASPSTETHVVDAKRIAGGNDVTRREAAKEYA